MKHTCRGRVIVLSVWAVPRFELGLVLGSLNGEARFRLQVELLLA